MAINPNSSRITNEIWYFWEEFSKFEPKVRLGGIYADKPGYHNTRAANMLKYPGDYSYSDYPADRLGPSDKAAAIDLTFPDAQAGNYSTIAKYSQRLLNSGIDTADNRLIVLREFYGNADNDTDVEGWDYQRAGPASSDKSHLWHIHISFMRGLVTSKAAMNTVLDVLKGVPNDPLTPEDFALIADSVWHADVAGVTAADALGRTMQAAEDAAAYNLSLDFIVNEVRKKLGL